MKTEETYYTLNKTNANNINVTRNLFLSNTYIKRTLDKDYINKNKVEIKQISQRNKSKHKQNDNPVIDIDKEKSLDKHQMPKLLLKNNFTPIKTHRRDLSLNNYYSVKDTEQNNIKARAITIADDLISQSTLTPIKYYNSSNRRRKKQQNCPLYTQNQIKDMYDNDPHNKHIIHSYDIQMDIFGKEQYRDAFLEGVKQYKAENTKYNLMPFSPLRADERKSNDKVIKDINRQRPFSPDCNEHSNRIIRNTKKLPIVTCRNFSYNQKEVMNSMLIFDRRIDSVLHRSKQLVKYFEENRYFKQVLKSKL